jgi:hypothetical protein
MGTHGRDVMDEEKIQQLIRILNENGKGIPTSIGAIHPFPVQTYEQLRDGIRSRTLQVLRFSLQYESHLFDLMASSGDKIVRNLGLFVMFGVPVLSVALGIFLSWWWLATLPLALLGIRIMRSSYNRAIWIAAVRSEPAFNFLYFNHQISVLEAASDRNFFWQDSN